MDKGKVYIIGVGPGDYKLITLKAVECIKKSDVIVYDRLISSKILDYAKEGAELIYVGKKPDCHAVPQEGINSILVEKALEGKTVARVKGGDPFVFGRGGEEVESLYEKGIDFEIIPGITSAIAVPEYAGIPVTHRDYASSLHIITGHERPDKDSSSINYEALSKLEGTLVFLMGVRNIENICKNLIKYKKDKLTPAAVIERGTTADQRVLKGTLGDIAEKVKSEGVRSPAVTIIGDVVDLQSKLSWFPRGRLAGKRVLVTRAREQASVLVEKIEEMGGEAIEFPTIRIAEPDDYSHFDSVLKSVQSFKWIVFTSVNGVKLFFKRMRSKGIDIRGLSGVKVCAVGQATKAELNNLGLLVDYMPEKYTTDSLLKGMLELAKPGEKLLLARADIANPVLSEELKKQGIQVEDLTVYRTVPESSGREEIVSMLNKGKIDFITFTSSSTVRNFVSSIGQDSLEKVSAAKVVCIGPVTANTAEEMGINVSAVANVYTIDGLVEKLVQVKEGL